MVQNHLRELNRKREFSLELFGLFRYLLGFTPVIIGCFSGENGPELRPQLIPFTGLVLKLPTRTKFNYGIAKPDSS